MNTWNRWMCPTDRQLALRSKLRKGWTNLDVRSTIGQEEEIAEAFDGRSFASDLTADEFQKIARVMRENERLQNADVRRISVYKDKLAALKAVARGSGTTDCHLCGEEPSRICGARMHCRICGMITCSKCVIQKSMEAKNEASANSGVSAWFFPLLPSHKTKNLTWECKVCHKETQLWKKSGAWFYRYLPTRILRDTDGQSTGYVDQVTDSPIMLDEMCFKDYGEENGLACGRAARQYGATAAPEHLSRTPDPVAPKQAESCPNPALNFHDQGLGTLHFVLQYIPGKAALYIRIIKGENLSAHDSNGLSDPYVKMHLLPDTGKRTKLRTRTCQRTLNPIWDEEFCYSGVTKPEMATKVLRLSVLDEDRIGFDWMGEILYPLDHLLQHGRKEYSEVFLQQKNFDLDRSQKVEEDDMGKIMIGLYYAPAKNELAVRVIQCVNLIAMDPNGYSDPFVKLHLKPDDGTPKKSKTEVKRRTLNPEFDEEFYFIVTPQELPQKTLEITVWDKDFATKNDFMGSLVLGNRCTGERWSHWEVLLRQPYQRHDRWHALCPEVLLDE